MSANPCICIVPTPSDDFRHGGCVACGGYIAATKISEEYRQMTDSDWFRRVYAGKSLGETIAIDDALPPPPRTPTEQPSRESGEPSQ